MAAGDTISGQVRIVREDTEGNRTVVFGPVATSAVDEANGSLNPSERLYINTMLSERVAAPLQAKEYRADGAQFFPGERLIVQHQSASLEEAADPDAAGAFAIDVLKKDQNRGRVYPTTLSEADNEVTGTPTTSTSEYIDVFQETVADRQEIRVAGSFGASVVENA